MGWSDQLLFLGDLIDRGEDSRRVLEMVKDLVDNQGAICLSGNHEYMFLTMDSMIQKKAMITIAVMVEIQPLTLS